MLTELGTIREFETPNFRIVFDAIEENDLDLSFDDTGEVREKLESGEFIAFVARCRVFLKETDEEIGADYLGGCIYRSLEEFQDHRACGIANRKRIKQEGKFQIYRKSRPYEHCLSKSDKIKPRGLATRERAEAWAIANAKEPYEIFETGMCGSYFAGMISEAIKEARKTLAREKTALANLYVRGI